MPDRGENMADIERISVEQAHRKGNQALLVCAYEDEAKYRMANLQGVHLASQLSVPSGFAPEDAGNHLLLSVTRRSERCRSGSKIPGAGLYQRQSATGRSPSVESCGLRDGRLTRCAQAIP